MLKLMLIEDDQELRSLVKEYLKRYEYIVFDQIDFKNIIDDFNRIQPDLVLLDLNLPYYDGYFVCRSIRKLSTVPIIILSARSGEMDQIMALELGADDYITKPFTFEILNTKVKATIRRVYGEYAKGISSNLCIGHLTVDGSTLTMTYQQKQVELSRNEFKLLKKFIENKETFLPREDLIEEVWDDHTFIDDNTLTVNITRIKKKLSQIGLSDVIRSKRGAGYMLLTQKIMGYRDD